VFDGRCFGLWAVHGLCGLSPFRLRAAWVMLAKGSENRAASCEDFVTMARIACGAGMTRALRHDRGCGDRAVDGLVIRRSRLAHQAGEFATVAAHQLAAEEWH
jgi:hypothetical protein